MPEESFEQQARNMAELFSMEPQPVVWQRVQAAIAPKRRRRAAFLWFVLALFTACGLGFWLLKNKITVLQTKAVTSAASTKNPTVAEQNKDVKSNEKSIPKINTKNDAEGKKYRPIKPTLKTDFVVDNNVLKAKTKHAKTKSGKTQIQSQAQLFNNRKAVKQKGEKNEKDETVFQPQTHSFSNNDTLVDSPKSTSQNDVNSNADTAKTNVTIAIKTNDSLKQNKDSSVLAANKKKRKNKWQTGVVAEAGAGWLSNGLFNKQSFNSLYYLTVPSGSTFTDTVGLIKSQRKKMGVDVALGMSVHKNISKRLFFDGQMVYRYQQFSIQTITLTNLSTQANGNSITSNVAYRLHFANLYAGIGLCLFHTKHTSVAAQAGIDNGWLFSAKRKQNDSLQSLTAQGFQRWQPSLQFAVPVNIYANKNIRWQLSPFIRLGLRGLQNSGGSFQHHPLNSAGIRATYFFK